MLDKQKLQTKIFLDSGSPKDTESYLKKLGFLDGQTTNPSLVAKNPDIQELISQGKTFSNQELMSEYKRIIQEIHSIIPDGQISIEVYADKDSTTKDLLDQAEDMASWIPGAFIKFPTILAGLEALEIHTRNGGKANMTLVFTQEQAMAVHLATQNVQSNSVFISPFIGRLDDIRKNGLDLVSNIHQMYTEINSNVEVLAASIRNFQHIAACLSIPADILTLPTKAIDSWESQNFNIPQSYDYTKPELNKIDYKNLNQITDWKELDITHDLTTKGLAKFAEDWNGLLTR